MYYYLGKIPRPCYPRRALDLLGEIVDFDDVKAKTIIPGVGF